MAFSRGDFLAGYDQEAVDRQSFLIHQTMLFKVVHTSAGIMVRDGKTVQSLGAGLGHQGLRLRDPIGGKTGMTVKIDKKLHD
jgi:hypothetical protein